MLLPKGHQLTEMLVNDFHIRFLHVGQQGLLAILREKFWIVNGKNEIKRILKPCLKCFRINPKDVETFMGDLPNYRVEPTFPFFHTGVDYGGPIWIKLGGVRSKQTRKAWIALFVCMATKAIHLELVTDLTSATFIACLQRFISRRGRPQKMHSDNGTNFIGAKSDLQELKVLFNRQNQSKIGDFCAGEGIEWNTIPPRASHFGGEWEAGIKSMKFHYKRIAGNANLTYEETLTLLVQIESILNSRPINAMSNDPNDFNPLTPAHFLIGRSLTSFPEPDLCEVKTYRLSRWERIVQIRQHFWKRFSQEYVTSLQQRSKWFKTKPKIVPGMLVLLKEDNQPSLKWKLGRITDVHPGKDGIVRVVTVKTANSSFKRDTQKICILPTEDEVFK